MNHWYATAQRLERELLENNIPFWETYSIDRENGGYYTCLERDGKVYDTHKQLWMQWREVYMFAALYNSEFKQARFLELARHGYDFLVPRLKKPGGGFWYIVTAKGVPVLAENGGPEVYTESFAAIACAELFLATGEARYEQEAREAWDVYWSAVKRSENTPPALPGAIKRKLYGHYMIAVNVLQILKRCLKTTDYDARLAEIIATVWTFRHPKYGIILESLLADGSFDLESPTGRFTNPGHALEGMWFIMEYARTTGNDDMRRRALGITHATLEYGWDSVRGGIRGCRDILGKPVIRSDVAWWPQAEAALAALLAYEATGDEFYADFFRKIDDYVTARLRDPEYPEWFAFASVDGVQDHTYKGSLFKGFFHVPRYLLNATRICRRLNSMEIKEPIK